MKAVVDLSPLGSARPADPDPLLAWLAPVQERLGSAFSVEPEVGYLAWEVARWPADLTVAERAALTLLVLTALVTLRQGSTRLPLRGEEGRGLRLEVARRLLDEASPAVGLHPAQALEVADDLIDSGRAAAVVGAPGDFKPLVVSGPYLYLQKMHALEERFAAAFRGRIANDTPSWDAGKAELALHDIQQRPAVRQGSPVSLSADQVAAVCAAVRYPLAVISGGPGTGKTTVVVSILRVLARLGVNPQDVMLAAPTGKSAHRLGQAVRDGLDAIADPAPEDAALRQHGAEPQTLHLLLGYSQKVGRFLYHENNRLAGRVVVVDEASMIDLVLMERLVRSLRPEARLILLGDDHQLPSVEAGAVLRDLVGGDTPLGGRAIRLTESYRMRHEDPDGRNILTVSHVIDDAIVPTIARDQTGDGVICERASVAALAFHGVEFVEAAEGSGVLGQFLDRWHTDVIRSLGDFDELARHEYLLAPEGFVPADRERLERLFGHIERARILCLTRQRPTGANAINDRLHRRSLIAAGTVFAADVIPGEPVMVQENDYQRGLFNGDQGLVLRVDFGVSCAPMAVFRREDGFIAFAIEPLRQKLQISYALTVHKAQGSEYDQVALLLPDADLPINAREVLYTALTRSRKSVTILGTRGIFAQGIARRTYRSSGLAALLAGAPQGA
jgi:exodeoxyribonuclease V alpha subunit